MVKGTQNIHGILLLNKPLNISSNKALQKVKFIYDAKKAGHAGSLDPLATGMLPICFGDATKYSQYLLNSDKEYEVEGLLGQTTTTGDAEGDVLENCPVASFEEGKLQEVLDKFTGEIEQVPPMYSALKHNGTPLYKLARQGVVIERKARKLTIHKIEFLTLANNRLKLRVCCSKGTYIRTLIEDIGKELGCGAHVTQLHRTYVDPFSPEPMVNLEDLELMTPHLLNNLLLPVDASVSTLPKVTLDDMQVRCLKTGQILLVNDEIQLSMVRFYSESTLFLGVGEIDPQGQVIKRRLLSDQQKILPIPG